MSEPERPMLIYVLGTQSEIFDSLVLAKSADWEAFAGFNGVPLATPWTPVQVKPYRANEPGDFPYLAAHIPVLSEKAWQHLQPLIGAFVEAYELIGANGRFFALNVICTIDCLAEEQSGVERFPSGGIMDVAHYVLRENCWHAEPIFKVKGAEFKDVLVSDAFRQIAEEHGLRGALYQPAHILPDESSRPLQEHV